MLAIVRTSLSGRIVLARRNGSSLVQSSGWHCVVGLMMRKVFCCAPFDPTSSAFFFCVVVPPPPPFLFCMFCFLLFIPTNSKMQLQMKVYPIFYTRKRSVITKKCLDSPNRRRCGYFSSGGDPRRCPAGGLVAQMKRRKLILSDCVSVDCL